MADKIWNEIKDKKMDMFALPEATVSTYCSPQNIDPSKCYLITRATAALPALETALGNKYSVERVHNWLVVSKL